MTVGLSIVIPTYRRVNHLHRLLVELEAAIARFEQPVEVILADDSPPPEQAEVQLLAEQFGHTYLRTPHSVSAKRNAGWRRTMNDFVLFLDSDCEPCPDVLVEHWRSLHACPNIGGCLGLVTFDGPDSRFWRMIEQTPYLLPFHWPRLSPEVPWGPTANISFRKDALEAVGGFDESFPPQPGGEDVDLGLRVGAHGYRIVTNPHAVVLHTKATWLGWRTMGARLYAWGRADYYLYSRHPERVFRQMPRLLLVTALVAGVCALAALARGDLLLLLLPIVWFPTTLLTQAVLQHERFGSRRGSSVAAQLGGIVLSLSDEAGYSMQALRSRDLRALLFKMRYTDGQQIGEWHYGGVRVWSMLLGFALVGVLALWLS